MARVIGKLSAAFVGKTDREGLYGDGGGLYLHINGRGAKSWTFRFMLRGRAREMGLGPVHAVSLAAARQKAAQCRALQLQGIDPIEQRNTLSRIAEVEAAHSMTFEQCAKGYIKAHEASWRHAKHHEQWTNSLIRYVSPVFGSLPVRAVDVALVMKVLEPIWTTRPETAVRVRGRIETVLDWAKVRGFRDGDNPARWRGHLSNLLPKRSKLRPVKHYAALSYGEIGHFMSDLRSRDGVAAAALEFLILTAARTSEVIGARWNEIDWAARMWTIPASRMKGARKQRLEAGSTMFDTKIAIVVREDLATWQKLNVTAFLTSGVVGANPGLLGDRYEDAAGHTYNALVIQPMIVLSADAQTIKTIYQRAMERGVRLSLYVEDMFSTGHDAANRAALKQYRPEAMNVVGLALREDKKLVDKITKGARMHS